MSAVALDTRRLRYFTRIVELGSLGRAARDLRVAQPALSQHLAALETDFGVQLLLRSHRGTKPTSAGMELYRHAQQILRQVQQAQYAVRSSGEGISGRVAFGLPPGAAASPVPLALMRAARERYPAINVSISEGMSGIVHDQLVGGRLDFALLYGTGPSRTIEYTPIYEEYLTLLVPLAIADAMPEDMVLNLTDIRTDDLIMPSPEHELRRLIDQHLIRSGITPHCDYEVDSLQVARSLLASGMGRALLSSGTAHVLAEDIPCRMYRVRPNFGVTLSICVQAGFPLSEPAQLMFDLLREKIVELVECQGWQGVSLYKA